MSNLDAFLEAAERAEPKPIGGYAVEEPTYFLKEETWKAIIQALKEAKTIIESTQSCTACSCRPYGDAYLWLDRWEKEFSSEGGS